MKNTRTIYVPVGLPGSGKTTYFNILQKRGITRINMDKFISSRLSDVLLDVLRQDGDLYLDGLFLTKISQDIIIQTGENIVFLWFDVKRSTCLQNDRNRKREKNSEITIKYTKVHKPEDYLIVKL